MKNPFDPIIGNKFFRFLWYGQIFSQISLNIVSFLLLIQIYQLTKSNTAVSFMLLTIGIPAIIFGTAAGIIVEKMDKRKVLFIGNFIRALILLLFALFPDNTFLLYVFAFLLSLVTQFFIPAEAPSIPLLVPVNQLLAANSLFTISFYISTVFGYILAGPLINLTGQRNSFLAAVFLMIISCYYLYLLPNFNKTDKIFKIFDLKLLFSRFQQVLKFVIRNQRIYQGILLMTYTQVQIAMLSVLAPGFADRILSVKLADSSVLIMGPAAIGLVIGAFIVGFTGRLILKSRLIFTGMLCNGLVLLLLSFIRGGGVLNFVFTFILLLTLGICLSFVSVPANTILQEDSDDNFRASIYGILTSLTGGAALIPVMVSGILADYIGITKTLMMLALVIILFSIYYFPKKIPYLFTKK